MSEPEEAVCYYILDEEGRPTPCDNVLVWADWMEVHRWIGDDTIENGLRVTTIFVGIAHEAPWLFSSCVFPASDTYETLGRPLQRASYETIGEARAGHALLVAWARQQPPRKVTP